VAVLLVRHAVALARRKWHEPDALRPLAPRGVRQAEALPEVLADYEVRHILSSSAFRCVDTVRPLAKDRGLEIEESDDLAEGSTHLALVRVRARSWSPSVLCSHGDVIPWVLDALAERDGVDLGLDPKCAKGSTWALEFDGSRCARATYIPPPA
jgi:phosphohistidine phosphatase SixA